MRTTWLLRATRVVAAGRSRGTGRMMHSALGVRAAAVPGAWPMAAREKRTATYAGAPAERSLRRFLSMGGPIVASQKSLGAAAATPAHCLWHAVPRSALSCLPRGISPSPCARARGGRGLGNVRPPCPVAGGAHLACSRGQILLSSSRRCGKRTPRVLLPFGWSIMPPRSCCAASRAYLNPTSLT
jgi:hypothetical protein